MPDTLAAPPRKAPVLEGAPPAQPRLAPEIPASGEQGEGRPRLQRRIGLTLAALLLAAGVGAAAYQLLLRPVEVAVATPAHDVPVEVYGLGSVEARVVSTVGFEVSGTLRALHADQGDRVAAGAILAGLDSRQQEARVAQAEAGVAQARAALDEAEAALGRAEVVLAQARRTGARRQELVRRQVVSDQAAEEAHAAVETAAAERLQAASRIRVARANLEQAEATLTRGRTLLAQHQLNAPFAAFVVTRQRELGAPVRVADAVFDLVDPDTVWLRITVLHRSGAWAH